jgi:hypothetical protein
VEHASTYIITHQKVLLACNFSSFSAQSWFEAQQAAEGEEKEVQEIPSVCAGENPEDTFCAMCHDKFEQFYNEEKEEWHLRAAVRVDGKTYHPLCYDDYKVSIIHYNVNTYIKTLIHHLLIVRKRLAIISNTLSCYLDCFCGTTYLKP